MWTLSSSIFAIEKEKDLVLWKLEKDNTIKQLKNMNWYIYMG